jgi:ketosteroid isomerase-like protein
VGLPRPTATTEGPVIDAAIRAEFARWQAAYKNRDLAGTMAIFDPAVRFAFQGSPDADYDALRRSYVSDFGAPAASEWVATIDEVLGSGDLAVEFSSWKLLDRSGVVQAHNRSMDLFRRNAAGQWRIIRSLNDPVSPAPKGSRTMATRAGIAGPRTSPATLTECPRSSASTGPRSAASCGAVSREV